MGAVNRKILCVDDEPNVTAALERQLRRDYQVYTACDGPTGLEIIRRHGPFAVVIADYQMPIMDGTAFLSAAHQLAPETVRVMLTASARLEVAVGALHEGRVSRFLTKPWEGDTLRKTLEACVAEYHEAVQRRHLDIACEAAQQEIICAARLDKLLGIFNRATLDDYLVDLHDRAKKTERRYLALMADVDHFKSYNDTYGHAAGDQALHAVAQAMAGSLREGDFIGRYGGEEIVVLCDNIDPRAAQAVAERLRAAVWNLAIPHQANEGFGRVSVSLGGAFSSGETAETATDVIVRSDACLYAAKRTGRNKAVIAEATDPPAGNARRAGAACSPSSAEATRHGPPRAAR